MDNKSPYGARYNVKGASHAIPPTGQSEFVSKVFFKSSANMEEIPESSIDLIVTSPPYFCIKDYAKNGHQNGCHSETHPEDYGLSLIHI